MSIENKGLECLGKRKTVFVWGNSSNKHRLAMIWKIEKYLNWGAVPNYLITNGDKDGERLLLKI